MSNGVLFDVAIIGCGPAGNKLAYNLGIKGVKVLLLDKASLPRNKRCGGGISRKTIEKIGYSVDEVIEKEMIGAYLTLRNEVITYKHMPGVGLMVERAKFDYFMTRKAVDAGAKLCEETEFESYEERPEYVEIKTNNGIFKAKILVGADGVYSKVRKIMHPSKKIRLGHAILALLYPRDGMLESFAMNSMFDFGGIIAGYGWIFPKRDHFSIGLFKTRNSKNNMKMKSILNEFISRNKVLRNYEHIDIKGSSIPLKPISKDLAVGRVLLVGDAAGLGESFYGEGIYYALWSANIACDAILDYLEKSIPLESYNKKIRVISRNLFFSRLTARIFYAIPRFGYHQMVRNKWVNHYFSQLIYGKVDHTECFIKTLVYFPLWIFAPKYDPIDDSHLK